MKAKRLRDFWHTLWRPATHLSFGVLALGGFVAGIVFWGGLNTAVKWSNSEAFCLSCHEMKAAPFAELQRTIHYSNRSGVRAVCADCHVPHEWTAKMARKMQASKEVWGKLFGTLNTPEKYEAKRLEMARREWQRLKRNDSLECRNCHNFDAMDFSRQRSFAARAHADALGSGQATCIDCHKGIAHRLPDMSADAGQEGTPTTRWQERESRELLLRNLRQKRLQVAVDTGAGTAQ